MNVVHELKETVSKIYHAKMFKTSTSENVRFEDDPCTNQMRAFLAPANFDGFKLYNFKWIVPNILKVR